MNDAILAEAQLMKKRVDYYPYYEKLIEMRFNELIAEAPEYKILAEHYPHLAESIKLKMEIERLKEKSKSLKDRSARLKIEREIIRSKAKLRLENVLKRLHRENNQEIVFNYRFTIRNLKKKTSSGVRGIYTVSLKEYINFRKDFHKSLRKVLRKTLPPTIFNLKSLDLAEKGLSVRGWVQERYKKHQ